MKILALDTSTGCGSATILDDGIVIGHNFINTKITHSETIIKLVDNILDTTRTNIDDIDIFACSKGPGSFTGVRIASSIIKGFCFNGDIPCISVSTLLGLAYNLIDTNGIILTVLDARRNQFYTAVFKCENGKIKRLLEDSAIDIDKIGDLIDIYDEQIYLLGDGATKCYEYLKKDFVNVRLSSQNTVHSSSLGVALACFNDLDSKTTAKTLIPNYIRLSQAEKDLKEKQKRGI